MVDRPNFFQLLDLDPAVNDITTITKAIQDKKARWSIDKGQGNAANRRRAAFYLDLLADIQKVMNDPEARRIEADDARRRSEQERRQRFARLADMIDVLRADGDRSCSHEDVIQLVKALDGGLTEAEIVERLKVAGITIGVPNQRASTGTVTKPRLDPMKMDRIRRNLDLIKVKDLYEFLQAGYDRELRDGTNAPVYPPLSTSLTSSTAIRHVSVGILGDRAREINNVLVGLPSDPGAAVRKSVAGECMDIFKSKDDKAKYDNALAVEAMEGLRQQIELAGREDGFLSIEEQDVLIRQALARHVKTDDARAYLEQFAQQRTPKWRLQAAAKLPSENLPQCGYCSTLAGTANAERCEQCGEPLNIKCPRCSVLMPTSSAACKKCGCRIGDAPIVRDLLRHGQEHRITGHLVAALER